jgi:hypothetical protein
MRPASCGEHGSMGFSMRRRLVKQGALCALIVALLFVVPTLAEEAVIQPLLYPLFTTTAGQSADIITLNILVEEAGLKYDYCDVPTVEMLATGVGLGGAVSGPGFHVEYYTDTELYPVGTPFKTLIVVIGASLKGMGASGLTIDAEVSRTKKVLAYCQENGILVVAVHIGGLTARGAEDGDNEVMIDAVAPYANYIIVTAEGNQDGRFTQIAEERGIPLTQIDYALGLVDVLKQAFGVEG